MGTQLGSGLGIVNTTTLTIIDVIKSIQVTFLSNCMTGVVLFSVWGSIPLRKRIFS